MNADIIKYTQEALWLVLVLSGPPIAAATACGLFISILQAVTQIQEQTLSFAVKLVAVIVTLFLSASLLGETLHQFSLRLFTSFPDLVR